MMKGMGLGFGREQLRTNIIVIEKKKQSSSANCYIIFRQHTSKNEKLKAQTNAGTGHTYTIL